MKERMMALIFSFLAMTGIAQSQKGQGYPYDGGTETITTYGDVSELFDVRTVYVFTSTDLEVRDNIIKNLKKYKGISVVNDMLQADVILVYGASRFSLGYHTHVWSDSYGNIYSTTSPKTGVTGVGYAVKFMPPNTIRLLWQFEDTAKWIFERRPSTNFARNFIKTLKKLSPVEAQ